ncbi:MAG: SurA domain protein [Variovorax sp.]|nr:SurA domain protein [Variovorax sp.]
MNSFRHQLTAASLACLGALTSLGAQAQQGLRPAGSAPLRFGAPPATRLLAPSLSADTTATPRVPARRAAEYIVALVNSEPITNTEVQSRLDRVLEQAGPEAQRMPRAELARQVLERLIVERAQLQQAKEIGLKIDDTTIDQAEETVARQNQLSVAELRRRVVQEGLTPEQFRKELRDQLLFTRLRDKEVEPRVRVTDLEVDQYLEAQRTHPDASAPREINLAHVMVAVPENATPAQLATLERKAQAIAARARAGDDFAKLAAEASDSPDRANGGALGLRSAERYPPLFVEATQSTAVGGIAGPVRSDAGFHVIKVLAKGPPGMDNATVVQTRVHHILLRNDAKRSTAEAVAQLAEFKRRIQSGGADFASLARDNSQDGSAKDGGELGWRRAGEFVPEFEEAVDRLAPGQISDPVVSRFGVHLIQVEERREAKLTQAEQRDAVRAKLREKKLEEAFETWLQELRARAYVEYREPPQG